MNTKVALITGSGKKRVGNAIALALAKHGFDIAIHYNNSKKEAEETVEAITSLGQKARAYQADLNSETEIKTLFTNFKKDFSRLDCFVSCASIWEPKKLEAITASDVEKNFRVNTLGTFLSAKEAGLFMASQPEGGCIITLGDWAVIRPYLDYADYFVSKGSIETMTRSLAVELSHRNPNVRVNCIHPGPVMLPDNITKEEKEKIKEATLVKRLGAPEDVAKAVLFFLDNDFITGASLPVDGGRSISSRF